MEDIIRITQLALSNNPALPEVQKELLQSLSISFIIPIAISFVISEFLKET